MPRERIAARKLSSTGDGHLPLRPKPLAERLMHIETTLEIIQQNLDVQFKPIAALQAEVDLLNAKLRGH